jgi:hypothetical protein
MALGPPEHHPLPRIRMIDGFNKGRIDFEGVARSTAPAGSR